MTLSADEWNDIKPVTRECKRKRKGVVVGERKYLTLKPGKWTDIVFDNFHLHTRLPCKITFKKNHVYENGISYVKIYGYCYDCDSNFTGEIIDKPGENTR